MSTSADSVLDSLSEKPEAMAELVAYQPGAVVSRTVIKKKTGTITLFAFDAGQGLSEHTAPFAALLSVIDGEGEVTIAGTNHTLKTGDVIILPTGKPHSVQAHKRFKMLLVMIRS